MNLLGGSGSRRRLLVCALFKHRIEWRDTAYPSMDAKSYGCRCSRCGFIFGGFTYSYSALRRRDASTINIEEMKQKEERRVNAW